MKKYLYLFVAVCFLAVSCNKEVKKEKLALNISGMTCEIGCAKKIASDLSKKEGVLNANVAFKDSIATIEYDANVTNKADLMAFVNGIGDGKTYKSCEKKACNKSKQSCDKSKKSCDKKPCDKNKTVSSKCDDACKKACAEGSANCKDTCDKECKAICKVKSETNKTACADDCSAPCCKNV